MSTENKFREKWIVLDEKTNEFKGIGDVEYSALSVGDKQLKFVEIAAVEQLKAENEYLKFKNENQAKTIHDIGIESTLALRSQVSQLKSKLAKAKENFEAINSVGMRDDGPAYGAKQIAKQALLEIGEG